MDTDTPHPLAGFRVAVTGSNRGIGAALVDAFSRAGAAVIAHARTAEAAERVASGLRDRAAAATVIALAGDLRDPSLPDRLGTACAELGGLDALVLNAGALGPMQHLVDTDHDAFREVMEVNVDAQLRLFLGALPHLVARRGRVVWMTSGLGHFALPGYGVYCVSKHAVEGLARLAACEHGDDGVVSVAVAPGMVQTEMLTAALGGADISEFATPEHAAAGFVRLLVALGPEHNGQVLDIAPWLPDAS